MPKNYFSTNELSCPCALCTGNTPPMSPVLMNMMNEARADAGIPFTVNSAYRCTEHNADVGGRPASAHLFGLAMDIACGNNHDRFLIARALFKAGFTRIIIYKTFIHADIDGTKPPEILCLY